MNGALRTASWKGAVALDAARRGVGAGSCRATAAEASPRGPVVWDENCGYGPDVLIAGGFHPNKDVL